MQLIVNGDPRTIIRSTTVEELLVELALDARAVVVEHNRIIVRRPALASTLLAEGDVVEIVHFVGGG